MGAARRSLLYGFLAEFENPEHLVSAAKAAHTHGFRQMDAYSSIPVEGLAFMLRLPKPHHPLFNSPEFLRVLHDRYFLCIRREDSLFDPLMTWDYLRCVDPMPSKVIEVRQEEEDRSSVINFMRSHFTDPAPELTVRLPAFDLH